MVVFVDEDLSNNRNKNYLQSIINGYNISMYETTEKNEDINKMVLVIVVVIILVKFTIEEWYL